MIGLTIDELTIPAARAAASCRHPPCTGHPCIYTWNAEENGHILVVTERIGFRPVGSPRSWRLDL